MTKHRLLRIAVGTILVSAIGVAAAVPANAAPGPTPNPGMRIVRTDGAGTVQVPASSKVSKTDWLATYGNTVQPMSSGTLNSSGYAPGPAGSQSFHTYGSSHWSSGCGFWSCTTTFSSNSSTADWLGSSPYNAQSINASMKWWLSGIDISVSIPAGAGFTANGSALTWMPGAVNDTWIVSLNYSAGINLNAQYINSSHFTDQADIEVGNNWYHVQGN